MYPGRADMLCPSVSTRFGPKAEISRASFNHAVKQLQETEEET